jgi:hypothetical protein
VCIFSQKPGLQAGNIEPFNNDHNLKNSRLNCFFLMPMFLLGNFSKTPFIFLFVGCFLAGQDAKNSIPEWKKVSYGFQGRHSVSGSC